MGDRDNRIPSYPAFSLDTLRSLRVPDFTALEVARLNEMWYFFQDIKKETLLPFSRMTEDPVRLEIDRIIGEALELDEGWLESVRAALCREPAITASSATA